MAKKRRPVSKKQRSTGKVLPPWDQPPSQKVRLLWDRSCLLPPLRAMTIWANYHQDELTGQWSAELFEAETAREPNPEVLRWVGMSATPRAAFDAVMVAVDELVDLYDADIQTLHAFEGDPLAWIEIAQREGFAEITD
jgi:hypothetical protein